MVGPEMLQEMENMVRKVQQNLKEAHDRHKSYADQKRRHLEFQVGDHVYLKVKAQKILLKLGNCAKMAPRFCGPFEILARIGPIVLLYLVNILEVLKTIYVDVLNEILKNFNLLNESMKLGKPQKINP
jgi:hypothetical protein